MDDVFEEIPQSPPYSEQTEDDIENLSLGNRRQNTDSRRETKIETEERDQPKIRAKSARELVKSQEHLLDLLQTMKSDISKMDREASRIKEDIVRSNQLFHVMVKMEKTHHLQRLPGGYNIFHSLPRETYMDHRYRYSSPELNRRYLDQLSTFRPNTSLNGRRSILSTTRDHTSCSSLVHSSSDSRRSSRNSRYSNSSSADDSYSGNSATESEIDSSISRQHADSSRDFSQDSDNIYDDAGSSTESVCSLGRNNPQLGRRSSYFYTLRVDTPQQVQSDEIDL